MIKLFLKKIISAKGRRFLRKLQRSIRQYCQPFLYQYWILKYDCRRKKGRVQEIGEGWLIFLDPGARLTEDALEQVATLIQQKPDTDLIYADSDFINCFGMRSKPYFKTDFDPYLFQAQNYLKPFFVVRKTLVDRVGTDPVQLASQAKAIQHIPKILCHARQAFEMENKIAPIFALPQKLPLISMIIPTKDGLSLLKPCIDSIFAKTRGLRFEILIVNNNSEQPETLRYFDELRSDTIKILDYPHPFNYSAINNFGARAAQGEILLLLNNDVEVISENWLADMLRLILRPDVGVVGAKLYYPDDTIQHAGMVLGIGGVAQHVFAGMGKNASGYFNRLQLLHCCSAVTAACLMIRKALYEEIGGLDEEFFPVTCNDVDLCLKVRKAGHQVVWTPSAKLYHKESATRGEDISPEKRARALREEQAFRQKWGEALIQHDPFYNPNLTLRSNDYALAFPPRNTECTPG